MSPRHHHLLYTWCTHEVTEIVRAHTGPSQVQITQHSKEEVDTKLTPYQAATYNGFLLEKGKQAFSKGLSLALSTTLHARPRPCSKVAAEHKTDCRDFCVLILFQHFFLAILGYFVVVCFHFCFDILGMGRERR